MIRRLVAAALAVQIAVAVSAAARASEDASASTPTLWRADRADGRQAFYLIGSVHVGRRSMLRFAPAIDRAWVRCSELVLEISADELAPEVIARLADRYAWIPPPETLRDRVSPSLVARVERYFASREDGLLPFRQMQPWAIAQEIATREARRAGLDPAFGVDRYFAGRAREAAKPVVGLETAESQIQILAWLPPETQEQLLLDTLDHTTDARDGPEGLVRAWQRGDDAELERIVYRSMHETPKLATYFERLLLGRSETMTQRLASLARDGKLRFAVIGAGHMVGERGIPRLLRDYGFRIERVRYQP